MPSLPSLRVPAAALLLALAPPLTPFVAAASSSGHSSVFRPGLPPRMKGSESRTGLRGGGGGAGGRRAQGKTSSYCDADRIPALAEWGTPGVGKCLTFPENKREYAYPQDFLTYGDVRNEMSHYVCPASGKRVIVSNSIPDHDINQANMNFPCEQLAYFELPLVPTKSAERSEAPPQGTIGVATNGVHLFGAQEAEGGNALEENGQFRDARFWYGHATASKRSHYHSPLAGHDPNGPRGAPEDDELVGWALDGFGIYGFTDEPLDECNGRVGPDGTYRYHVRYPDGWSAADCWDADIAPEYCNEAFPGANSWNYILGCYWGDMTGSKMGDSSTYTLPSDCELAPVDLAPARRGPNFIVMQPDDLPFFEEWTPPAHNNGGTEGAVPLPAGGMPNLARMMGGGLVMGQAYAASSLCGTSRYSTITGRYPSRSSWGRVADDGKQRMRSIIPLAKLEDEPDVADGMDCGANNLAATFGAGGYRTGVVGKWHLQKPNEEHDYDEVRSDVRACGFDYAEAIYPENMAADWASAANNGGAAVTHNMEHVVARAIEFMEDSLVGEDSPFFLYLNPTVPHRSANVSEALANADCRNSVEGYLPEEPVVPFGMTQGGAMTCRQYRDTVISRAGPGADDVAKGSIWVDDAVGAVYDYLESKGELDNTFFLFQMDQGQEQKSTLYEGGLRIFQLVHYPAAFGGGRTFDGLVSTVDIGPTMLDYAGLKPYYGMDGASWRDAAEDSTEELAWKDRCLAFELEEDRAVRCGCHKLLSIGGGTSTTTNRGQNRGFTLAASGMNFFDLCDGGSPTSVASPGPNPEVDGTAFVPSNDVAERLTTELQCHDGKTLPSIQEAPDYVGCGSGDAPPCADLETFPQAMGSQAGTPRDCDWVLERGKCLVYPNECPVSCGLCTPANPNPSPTDHPTYWPTYSPTPTPSCQDKGTFGQKWGSQAGTPRDCEWVLEIGKCEIYPNECPVSCGICCEDSESWTHTRPNGRVRDCSWVASRSGTRCSFLGNEGDDEVFASLACPVACGQCSAGNGIFD